MHIVHTEASLGWGGQEIRILTEAAGMIDRGHKVELACPREARIFAEAPRFAVPVSALPIGRKRPRGVLALRRFLASRRVDAINAHSSTDAWLATLASRSLARQPPLVRTRHISAAVARDPLTRWLYTRATAQIVTTGEAIRAQLIRDLGVLPARVSSIPTGIDPKRFAPADRDSARRALGLPGGVPLAGIVATLRSWKGHRILIDALPLCANRELQLVIVGDGPQRETLAAQVAALRLESRVRFAGDRDDIERWLAALDVFVLPSYANEGVPQALLQAMLCRLPCVTTDAGAIGEAAIADQTAVVVAQQDAVALAAGIDRVLGDPALAKRIAETGRERALSRFGLATMLDRMEAVFQRAVDGHARR
ncbi:MAG TPA: glycosyltransferase family 4 protein [Casimicrobiaceae bacterium]|nr:glycosyltransferase family 4 protein [Casimicrobiaceae bacterium]